MSQFYDDATRSRAKRETRELPTVTAEQLSERYKNCNACEKFNGWICNDVGCCSHKSYIDKYFDLILDPNKDCPYTSTGFKKV